MKLLRAKMVLLFILALFGVTAFGADDRVEIAAGRFTPLYGVERPDTQLEVGGFALDRYAVTNQLFHRFLLSHRDWLPARVSPLLADKNYLRHWSLEGENVAPLTSDFKKPVVNVSWFVASAYCKAQGGRLPTVLEWEYVAAASHKTKDASRDPEFVQELLGWYSKPSMGAHNLAEIGQRHPNYWGVHDLHGLVWEWTDDFNSVFVGGDNRRDGEVLNNLFCGAGAAAGSDKANYAAFMRYALRSSLKGNYTTPNLGFRCAYDIIRDRGELR